MANPIRSAVNFLADTPSSPDDELTTARAALADAEAAYSASLLADDPKATDAAQAAVSAAQRAVERAEARLSAKAQHEQAQAQKAAEAQRVEHIRARDKAAGQYAEGAKAAQQAIDALAAAIEKMDAAGATIAEAQRAGVCRADLNYTLATRDNRIAMALQVAGVLPGRPSFEVEPLDQWGAAIARDLRGE